MSMYDKACGYAFVLMSGGTRDHIGYKDIVHWAWLNHHDRGRGNLFESPEPYVMKAVKLRWLLYLRDQDIYWNYNKFRKQYFKFDDIFDPESPVSIDDDRLYTSRTPLDYTESKDFLEKLDEKLLSYHSKNNASMNPKRLHEYAHLTLQGYPNKEIAEKWNASHQYVHNYRNKVRTIIMDLLNSPFNGNKLKTPKKNKITRKYYDEHKEKYAEYVFDTDRWADHNEFFEQRVHKDRDEGLIIVESKTLDQ